MFIAAALLVPVLLLPVLQKPLIGLALVGLVAAALLASRSVAYPLALAGVPSIIAAIVGSNPIPKGGVTLIFAVWVSGAVAIGLATGKGSLAGRAFLTAPVLLAFGLLGLMLLRLGASPDQAYGSTKAQLYAADNLVFLLGAIFVGTRRSDLRLYLYLILGIAATAATLLVAKLLSGSAVTAVGGRFSLAATEYPIYLGRTSANGILIAVYVIVGTTNRFARTATTVALLALIAALLAAGSRGPVVALLFGLVIFTALTATNQRARNRMMLAAAALAFATVIVPLIVPGSVITRSLSTIAGSASGLSSNGRSALWVQAYTIFEQHPFLGVGTGGFSAINVFNPYPHNVFLEMAAELGLAGLAIIVALIGTLTARLVSTWRHTIDMDRLDAAVVFALFINALVNALVSGAIQDNRDIWIWGGLGVGMSVRALSRRPGSGDAAFPSSSVLAKDTARAPDLPAPSAAWG